MKSSTGGGLGPSSGTPAPSLFPQVPEDFCFMFLAGDSQFAALVVKQSFDRGGAHSRHVLHITLLGVD